jgi:hypothetical protein
MQVDPDTVGQCTGLKDKGGTLIYGGDIVTDSIGRNRSVVWTVSGSWAMEYCEAHIITQPFDWSEFEIVGNIHDNPELLEA